jgi:hypothetical protein
MEAIVQLADPLVKIAPGQQPLARHAPPAVPHRSFKLVPVLLLADLGFTKTLEMPTAASLVILPVRLALLLVRQTAQLAQQEGLSLFSVQDHVLQLAQPEPMLTEAMFVKVAIAPARIVVDLLLLNVRNVTQLDQIRSSIQEPVLQIAQQHLLPPLIMVAPAPLVIQTVQLAMEQRILNAFHALVPATSSHLLGRVEQHAHQELSSLQTSVHPVMGLVIHALVELLLTVLSANNQLRRNI